MRASGALLHLSPPLTLRGDLTLNPGLLFSWLGCKSASPRNSFVFNFPVSGIIAMWETPNFATQGWDLRVGPMVVKHVTS